MAAEGPHASVQEDLGGGVLFASQQYGFETDRVMLRPGLGAYYAAELYNNFTLHESRHLGLNRSIRRAAGLDEKNQGMACCALPSRVFRGGDSVG
ncbi:hypothetical protein AJ80_08462 [Polytolypa hystricis UAMH7299]|uniref:Uncharacterized protein n=1 Tax=Polytolypa hystricis (strain UAMH7299) TaxID=1447883 RepID=A0A2B7X7U8_POLH7|nr:hypothetical protein AJ80_08462 [Polytolypa hystricis UAMH7299]